MLVKADLVHPGSRRLGTSLGLPLGPSCHSRHPNLALPHRASISGQADQSHALWVFGSAWGEHTTLNIFQPSAWLKRLKSFCFTKFHMFRISAALTFSSQLVQWSDIRLLHARRGRGRRFAWFHSIPFNSIRSWRHVLRVFRVSANFGMVSVWGKDVAEKEEEGGCKKCCFAFLDCMARAPRAQEKHQTHRCQARFMRVFVLTTGSIKNTQYLEDHMNHMGIISHIYA